MNPRTTLVLVCLNCLVVAGLLLTQDRGGRGGRKKFLPETVDLRAVVAVDFSRSKDWASFRIQMDEKKRWHLETQDGPLANQGMVKSLLNLLDRAPIKNFETGGEKNLGLNPPVRTLTLTRSDGRKHVIELGSIHPLAIGVFARIQGEEEIHLTAPDFARVLDLQKGNLREIRPFPFAPLDVKRMRLKRRTLSGEEDIEAERRWLVWFLLQPQEVRGTARLDDMVSALLGLRRSRVTQVPGALPGVEVTLETSVDAVTLDLWMVRGTDTSIARVRGEEDGFMVTNPEFRALGVQFRQLWNHRLFHDASSHLSRVEWKRGDQEAVRLVRDPTNWKRWWCEKPRKAPADWDFVNKFTQDLVRFQVDDLEAPGTDPRAVGLDAPYVHLSLTFERGAGKETVVFSKPEQKIARLRRVRPGVKGGGTGPIFSIQAARLDLLPRNVLLLLDRTIYSGDWKGVSSLYIQRGEDRFQLRNVGIDQSRHWLRSDISDDPAHEDGYVPSDPMRILLTHLLDLRAEEVIAASRDEADPAWNTHKPDWVITFQDTNASKNRTVKIAVGRAMTEKRSGRSWYPVWNLDPDTKGLSRSPFVYRIGPELVKKIRDVLPGD